MLFKDNNHSIFGKNGANDSLLVVLFPFNLRPKLCLCSPLGAFGKLHGNSLPVDGQCRLESLQDLQELRRLLLTKHTQVYD